MGHVRDEDGRLDDPLDGGVAGGEDRLDVLDAEGRLLGDGAVDEGALVVHVDLAGAVDGARGLGGVRLRVCETSPMLAGIYALVVVLT